MIKIKYETIGEGYIHTECPFKKNVDVYVGGGRCEGGCEYFSSRNRVRHIVYCKHPYGWFSEKIYGIKK